MRCGCALLVLAASGAARRGALAAAEAAVGNSLDSRSLAAAVGELTFATQTEVRAKRAAQGMQTTKCSLVTVNKLCSCACRSSNR